MDKPVVINIFAHDGLTNCYTGVGKIVGDTVDVLSTEGKYIVNGITGKYDSRGLGYSEERKESTKKKLLKTKGDLYEVLNLTYKEPEYGDISYGNLEHWKAASISAATVLGEINRRLPNHLHINLCLDVPFANVPTYFQQYGVTNNIFVWLPHSTELLHKVAESVSKDNEYTSKRLTWEREIIDFVSLNENCFVGYISEFMRQHLSDEYEIKGDKLVNFVNGLNLDSEKKPELSAEEIESLYKDLGLNADSKLVLSFGRLEDYKGFDFTIKVGKALEEDGFTTLLLAQPYKQGDEIVGRYENLCKECNPECKFIWDYPFNLPHKVLQLPNFKFILLPSIREPFGLIPCEIRLMNNPNNVIVASNEGGFVEQITDGVDGLLVERNDIPGSVSKLKSFQGNNKDFSIRGLKRIKENHDLSRNLELSINYLLNYGK